jgi:electron transport complex protein RnfD
VRELQLRLPVAHPVGTPFSRGESGAPQGEGFGMTAGKTLTIRSAPHLASGDSVDKIMFHVVLALLPVCAFAVYTFGLAALVMLATAVVSCVATEYVMCRAAGRESTIGDWSVAVTGLLYGLTLPPGLALWMVVVGGICAVGVGKILFGGLGYNPFNPALVGRALLQAAFPVAMTSWPPMPASRFTKLPASSLAWPFTKPQYDVISGATPLANWKFDHVATEASDLFLGTVGGSTGETSAVLILLGGVYLVARRMMSWQIPVAILSTVALCSVVLRWIDPDRYAGPAFMICSGGLMLGAVFMATDPVASPLTHLGCVVYGVLIGLLVVAIRVWGGMPEGVMYAILLGNAVSPHIDNWIQPRTYGVG